MQCYLLIISFFFLTTFSQNVNNCTTAPIKMKLISPPDFVLYYHEYKNCSINPQISYCELAKCRVKFNQKCYQYLVYIEFDETKCKQRCCQGVKKFDMQLYNGLECSSMVQSLKNSTNTKGSDVNGNAIDPQSQDSQQTLPEDSNTNIINVSTRNNYDLVIFVGSSVAIIVISFFICCCKCYTSQDSISGIDGLPQPQIITQRALNPIRAGTQQMNSKNWRLPEQSQSIKQMEIRQEECIICLNGSPNCSLTCGHIFDKFCIYTWLQKVFNCPLCKSKEITNVTVRCTQCVKYRYDCLISQMKASLTTEDVCPSCSMAQS